MTKRLTFERVERSVSRARWLVVPLVIGVAAGVGSLYGLGAALLTLAGSALLFVIFLFWQSLQSLTGESELTLEEALSLGAPSAEEEQKRAVLRALKDLEYERSVGKISQEDYDALSSRYRSEAKRLIRALDDGLAPARARVERLLELRLERARVSGRASDLETEGRAPSTPAVAEGTAVASTAGAEERATPAPSGSQASGVEVKLIEIRPERTSEAPSPRKRSASKTGTLRSRDVDELLEADGEGAEQASSRASSPDGRPCSGCETLNDVDARFCKHCGQPFSAAEPS